MRLATTAVASVLDGLSDADARRRDANLAAAPPPRRRRRSPPVFRFVLATPRANDPLMDSFSTPSLSFTTRVLSGEGRGMGRKRCQ